MKKQLLNERQIRKMMKFANISALSDTFIGKLHENEMVPDEDAVEEGMGMGMEGDEGDDDLEEEISAAVGHDALQEEGDEYETLQEVRRALREALNEEDEQPGDEGMGLGDEGGEADMPDMGGDEGAEMGEEEDDALASAMTALKALKLGLEELDPEAAEKIVIETEEEGEEGGDEDMGDMGDMGELGGEEEEGGMPPGLEESRRRQRKVVSEVTRRVAKRLMRINKRDRRR